MYAVHVTAPERSKHVHLVRVPAKKVSRMQDVIHVMELEFVDHDVSFISSFSRGWCRVECPPEEHSLGEKYTCPFMSL